MALRNFGRGLLPACVLLLGLGAGPLGAQQDAVFDAGGGTSPVTGGSSPWQLSGGTTVTTVATGEEVQISVGDASTTTVAVAAGHNMAADADAVLGTAVIDIAGGAATVTVTVDRLGTVTGGTDAGDAAILFSRAGGTATNATINAAVNSGVATGFSIRDTGGTDNTVTIATTAAHVVALQTLGAINLGNGTNVLNVTAVVNAGTAPISVDGAITFGTGNDTMTVTGGADTDATQVGQFNDDLIDFGNGTNALTVQSVGTGDGEANMSVSDLTFGTGNDTINVTTNGNTSAVTQSLLQTNDGAGGGDFALGDGTNAVTVTAGAGVAQINVTGNLTGGAGSDTLTVTKTAAGNPLLGADININLANGADAVVINAGNVAGGSARLFTPTLDLADGNDTITITAPNTATGFLDVLTINTGNGDDTINLTGAVQFAGGGSTFNLGADNDSITVTTNLTGNLTINGGAGNDTVNITSSGGTLTLDGLDFNTNSVAGNTKSATFGTSGAGAVALAGYTADTTGTNDTLTTSGDFSTTADLNVGAGTNSITLVSTNPDPVDGISINALGGDDTLTVTNPTATVWGAFDTIDLGNGTNSITFAANGGLGTGFDVTTYNPGSGADSLTIAGTYASETSIGGSILIVNDVDLDGTGGSDTVTLSNGALHLAAPGTGNLTLGAGDTLRGNGRIDAGTVAVNGSIVSPGFSVGQIVLDGNYTATSTSHLIEITGTTNDSLLVKNGTATINAGTTVTFSGAITAPSGTTRYFFIQTDATGALTVVSPITATNANSGLFSFALGFVPGVNGDYFVDVTRAGLGSMTGLSDNQRSVGNNLEEIITGGLGDAELDARIDELLALGSEDAIREALTRLTSEPAGALANAAVARVLRQHGTVAARMAHHLRDTTGAPIASAWMPAGPAGPSGEVEDAGGTGAWAAGFGTWGEQAGNHTAEGFDTQTYGTALGLDKRIRALYFGANYAYSVTDLDNDEPLLSDGDATNHTVGAYAGYGFAPLFANVGASYGWTDNDARRRVVIGGLDRTATADFDSNEASVYGGAGYALTFAESAYFVPSAAVLWTKVDSEGYIEDGAGSLGLDVSSRVQTSFRHMLGAKVGARLEGAGITWAPELRFGWIHEYADNAPVMHARFLGAPGASRFRVEGAHLDEDVANLGATANLFLGDNARVYLDYDANVGEGTFFQSVTGGVAVQF